MVVFIVGNVDGASIAYDPAGRLVQGSAGQGAVTQTYRYGGYGNLTSTTTAPDGTKCAGNVHCAIAMTIDSTTNHLTSNQVSYDDAGNVTSFDGYTYTWDSVGMMHRQTGGAGPTDRQFIYDANDERIATYEGGTWTWTWRDLDGKVLRVMTSTDGPNGQIIDGLNKYYADRAKKDPNYKVRLTIKGDRDIVVK